MTKTLEQIQEENRKAIGGATTLDRVLIASSNFEATYYPNSNGLKVGIFNYDADEENEYLAMWDLTKPTLEEQDEQTQITINKLLTQIK